MYGHSTITELGVMYTIREMNNPLTNILLCIDLLQGNSNADTSKQYFDIIRKNAALMESSIRDLSNCISDQMETVNECKNVYRDDIPELKSKAKRRVKAVKH